MINETAKRNEQKRIISRQTTAFTKTNRKKTVLTKTSTRAEHKYEHEYEERTEISSRFCMRKVAFTYLQVACLTIFFANFDLDVDTVLGVHFRFIFVVNVTQFAILLQ